MVNHNYCSNSCGLFQIFLTKRGNEKMMKTTDEELAVVIYGDDDAPTKMGGQFKVKDAKAYFRAFRNNFGSKQKQETELDVLKEIRDILNTRIR